MNCDPKALAQAAKCFCLPKDITRAVKIYLLCQWASGGGVPENLTLPTIIGTVEVGADISGTDGTWENSPTSFTYQWFADGVAIVGATSNTYFVTLSEVGKVITFQVIASNPAGNSLPATSAGSAPVSSPGPAMAAAWSAQVVANGGAAPSAGTMTAVTTFIDSLYTSNILTKMHVINCIVPDSAIAALTPILKGTGLALWPDEGGLSAHLSVNGFQGGFSNTFSHTGIIPSVEFSSPNSSGISFYMRVASITGAPVGVRSSGGVSPWFELFIAITSAVYVAYNSAVGSSEVHNLGGAGSWGFVSGSRVAVNDMRIFSARSNVAWGQRGATNTNAPTTLPTDDIAFMSSVHDTNSWVNPWADFCSFFAVHEGLSSAEGQALFNAVQAMRTSLGGGFG